MDCTLIEVDLIAYHFDTLTPAERDQLEAHLSRCPHCVGQFIKLKRRIELGDDTAVAPSTAMRTRLRAAVEKKYGPSRLSKLKDVLFVPVPLYQIAALVLVVMAGLMMHDRVTPETAAPVAPAISDIQKINGKADQGRAIDGSNLLPKSVNYL